MRGEPYFYSVGVLKDIVASYDHIYQGIDFYKRRIYRYTDTNPLSIAEYKADFDRALGNIGRGKWDGNPSYCFRDYREYGRLQQIIISAIIGISDYELEGLGFWDISRLRGYAFYLMKLYLNGGNDVQKDNARY